MENKAQDSIHSYTTEGMQTQNRLSSGMIMLELLTLRVGNIDKQTNYVMTTIQISDTFPYDFIQEFLRKPDTYYLQNPPGIPPSFFHKFLFEILPGISVGIPPSTPP